MRVRGWIAVEVTTPFHAELVERVRAVPEPGRAALLYAVGLHEPDGDLAAPHIGNHCGSCRDTYGDRVAYPCAETEGIAAALGLVLPGS